MDLKSSSIHITELYVVKYVSCFCLRKACPLDYVGIFSRQNRVIY